ncbi:hypothetical protein [Vibrio breoganii]|uniref:hypothetical protein n=1 Tax=Vibrio breoganii TaxID=553239 RepID=UPI001F53628A|nr:hypothetical protein [Vibrio breoganii]
MKKDDLFIVMNPDVSITIEQFELLIDSMSKDSIEFATINLFKDKALSIYDPSIRNFPKLSTFIRSYLLNENPTIIDRSKIYKQTEVDWAAGSFLCFSAMHYEKLGGFDEKYFMYCEDIDICFRSKKSRVDLVYLPNVKAQHLARHNNRKLISKHFYWHIKSVIRFLYSRNFSVKNKSSIKKYEQ